METALSFDRIDDQAQMLAQQIEQKQEALIEILLEYESYVTALDEVVRSIKCLRNIAVEREYFIRQIGGVSAFLPLNLPLYSLILFGVIPSFFARHVYVRPPVFARGIVRRIHDLLNLSENFPTVQIVELERSKFVSSCVQESDVILFTGTHKNAVDVQKKTRKNSLFIFNGAGINPIIVTETANLPVAIEKTIAVKTFNSGQDCAGPDAILVHRRVADEFTRLLLAELERLPVGDYTQRENRVGRLVDPNHLHYLSEILIKYQHDIIYGGGIDFKHVLVYPTVILTDLADKPNYTEFFAPIFFVSRYDSDEQLAEYFNAPLYFNHAMYASVFGKSDYAPQIKKTVILQDQTILDIEEGNKEFGGYGSHANFVTIHGKAYYHPILISREIARYFIGNAS